MHTRSRAPSATSSKPSMDHGTFSPMKTRSAKVVAIPSKTPAGSTNLRKPLVRRNKSPESFASTMASIVKTEPLERTGTLNRVDEENRQPIQAFLRVRPDLSDGVASSSTPYLSPLSETTVQMVDRNESRSRIAPGNQSHPSTYTYTFTHVFPPETEQAEFFTQTTLPAVQDVLHGRNGLIFAYGVTNSGKTYTIQGGSEPGTAGIIPRTFDVVFNSLEGLQSSVKFRPTGLSGVEYDDASDTFLKPSLADEKAIASVFSEDVEWERSLHSADSTVVDVDRSSEYAVWVSYAEIYNEKIFDLLLADPADEAPEPGGSRLPRTASSKKIPRTTSTWHNLARLASSHSSRTLENSESGSLLVTRKALPLKSDPDSPSGKYIAGLREVRVHSAEEARTILRMGNINRRVFGTMANSASSRSHGIFTIKILKSKQDAPDGSHSVSVSRLSIVDLAGSERYKNTHTTGERLKEAGNINKSLMILGQCMESLRSSQTATKKVFVPFRHSKLTELFQDFFAGDRSSKAAMIVNVNPYDTGFDENNHVMRFAALAREVTTLAVSQPVETLKRPHSRLPEAPKRAASPTKLPVRSMGPQRRKVTLNIDDAHGRRISETHWEIAEEDEESVEDSVEEPINPLVDALFEEIQSLRLQLYEAEMRSAVVEAEVREEVMQEMEGRMMKMERMYSRRLMNEVEQNEIKTDAKIELLHQFGAFGHADQSDEFMDAADSDAEMS